MPSVALFNAANPATYPIGYAINFEPGEHPGWALGGSQYGLFAQDTWRVGQGLTLSLGLRFDAEAKLSTVNDDVDAMNRPTTRTSITSIRTWATSRRASDSRGRPEAPRGWRSAAASGCSTTPPKRHVCGVGRADRQSAPAGRHAHEHRLEQRDAESLLPRQHPVRRRCAGGSPECAATGDGLCDHQQHRAEPGGHLCHRERQ